ncbi:MAG: hypothetical protein GY778_32320 [bacterium]|nr:hypothetical protein [bacterium]
MHPIRVLPKPRPIRQANWLGAAALLCVVCTAARGQAQLFSDDFDAGTSGGSWIVFSHGGDYTADFAFDYAARGIPSAPHSAGGSTIGLHFTVNNNDGIGATDAVSGYPAGMSFGGNHRLCFDMWLNYNGAPGGGTGSTEFMTAGIHHAGTQVNWANNPGSDGHWAAVTGEGGDSNDYRAYDGGSLLSVSAGGYAAASLNHTALLYQSLFPSPTYETQGAPGKHWVEVEISHSDGVIEWRLNDMLIGIYAVPAGGIGNIMVGYMDTYNSIANPAADNFLLVDNVCVLAPDCNTNGTADDQDLAGGSSLDCNNDGVPDECQELAGGDYDVDGDADLDDFAALADCLAGPGVPPDPSDAACAGACLAAFDFDNDSAVDLGDFGRFQVALTVGVIPPRLHGAPTGSQFLAEVAGLSRTDREVRVVQEITGGNIPGFLRTFVPITVNAVISGTPTSATYYVTPDYLSIGLDSDFVRMPMTPLIAQPIADAFDCLLPTRKMVDDIYAQATVKLAPAPISPATVDITLATTFYRHHRMVEAQRAGYALGPPVGGIKKDVVITPLLATNPGKVAIYGWHQLNGVPIQPLYVGHGDFYADYSHGIRLVKNRMIVQGAEMSTADVLAHSGLHVLLSDEGVVSNPRY